MNEKIETFDLFFLNKRITCWYFIFYFLKNKKQCARKQLWRSALMSMKFPPSYTLKPFDYKLAKPTISTSKICVLGKAWIMHLVPWSPRGRCLTPHHVRKNPAFHAPNPNDTCHFKIQICIVVKAWTMHMQQFISHGKLSIILDFV